MLFFPPKTDSKWRQSDRIFGVVPRETLNRDFIVDNLDVVPVDIFAEDTRGQTRRRGSAVVAAKVWNG